MGRTKAAADAAASEALRIRDAVVADGAAVASASASSASSALTKHARPDPAELDRHQHDGETAGAGAGAGAGELAVTRPSPTTARRRPGAGARLPESVRLALVVVLSFSFSALGYSFLNLTTEGELATIARRPESKTETSMLAAWQIFGLALGWLSDFDGYDLASLALLSNGPATYLTSVFYGIRPLTAGAYLVVDVVSAFLPFLLLRQLSGAHSAAPGVPNRDIVTDQGIQVLTSLLSAVVSAVVLFLASRTFLPSTLVLHFEGVPTIKPATDAVLFGLDSPLTQLLCVLYGVAARTFIFTPLVTTTPTAADQEIADFDPVDATLGETVAYNLWGYSTQTKVSIRRTAVAMLSIAMSTYLQCAWGIVGVDSYGAAAYASIWVTSALVTGLLLRYVGHD